VADDTVLKIIRDNIRFPEASLGDLRSQVAACQLAERRLVDLHRRYGTDVVESAITTIFEQTEQKCRRAVEEMPDGVYEAESFLDGDPGDRTPIEIRVKITISGGDMEIDLSRCSEQRTTGINGRTLAGALVAYKALTAPDDPVNEGSFAAAKVIIPEGNIMMARYPAPMAGWSMILPTVVDTLFRALATAIPDRVAAGHFGILGIPLVFFGTDPRTGKRFVSQSIEGGGWGGRPFEDGESACVSICQGDVRNSPIENMELKVPLLVEERALRQDSGGPGRFRGGLGITVRVRALAEGRWNLGQSRRKGYPPWGLRGGSVGGDPDNLVRRPDETAFTSVDAAHVRTPADTVVIQTSSGGGGWGPALERDPERVLGDVLEGYVSAAGAEEQYGVVLTADGTAVDDAATRALREARAGSAHDQEGEQ
jgi:N-methylhydantoinase B